jgi:dihydroorotate dehydrogenase
VRHDGGVWYERVVRPALFRFGDGDAEAAHRQTVAVLARLARSRSAVRALTGLCGVTAPRTVFGVRFPNAVGLAAGMDKDGHALRAWPALGFGHVEVGTVTRHAQPGNPTPRLYRLPASGALVNRMGFNNAGAAALADRLRATGPLAAPLGISIGKSRITPVAEAVADYCDSLRTLYPYGDYFAINVSSPNTPGLRGLQDRSRLDELLAELQSVSTTLADRRGGARKPLLVKIAPDLSEVAIAELLEVCLSRGVAGLIATNTTLSRAGVVPAEAGLAEQPGGLSGRPLAARARAVVAFVHRETAGELPVIGVGGVGSVADATALLDVGASLVQLYTGFIYAGPGLVRGVARAAR